jgi:hypothetical protein
VFGIIKSVMGFRFAGIFDKKSRDGAKRSILESHDPYWSASLW